MKNYRYVIKVAVAISAFIYFLLSTNKVNSAAPNFILAANELVASGLSYPVQVIHAGDSTGRLFVVEQTGTIKIIVDGNILPQPFLNIQSLVLYGGERGLLGLAFHPQYEANGFFYINYSRAGDGATVIARYHVSADPNLADANSAFILMVIPQPYTNHNGGQVAFGADGYLYIGMGDGGSGGDPQNYAQNIESLLGKMLRINVDAGSPYTIPSDNPYVGKPGLDEIWAVGLRNPWRFSFDSVTGDLYIGDVGQATWEEVNFQAAGTPGGVNYGWRCREGAHPYSSSPPCNDPTFIATLKDPITEYSHSEGYSITGGFVYNGSLHPSMQGIYFFADYVTGSIWSIKKLSPNPLTWSARILELDTSFNISCFGEGQDGELYVCDYLGGKIWHLTDASGPSDLTQSRKVANSKWADPGETITFTIQLHKQQGSLVVPATMTDSIPSSLAYVPGTLTTTNGSINDSLLPNLVWSGQLTTGMTTTVQYQALVSPTMQGSIYNTAIISIPNQASINLSSSVFVPRPQLNTTKEDFFLPGTQPNGLNTPLLDSLDCDTCHTAAIYDRWRGSMMSQAGRDPLMWAALEVANNYVPGAGELCLRCHTSMGWFAGHSQNPDGSLLTNHDIANGISCQTCHRLVDPDPQPGTNDDTKTIDIAIRNNLTLLPPPGATGSGMMVIDPEDRRRGPFSLGPTFQYHTAFRTDYLGQTSEAQSRARLCGTCHNVSNPLLTYDEIRSQYWINSEGQSAPSFNPGQLFPIETTYGEWLNSTYANGGVLAPQFAGSKTDHIIEACQDCHLPRTTGIAADIAFNPYTRDCVITGCLPEHNMVGANTWIPQILQLPSWRLSATSDSSYLNNNLTITQQFLSKSATLEASLIENNGEKVTIVKVTNQTGHKLPTGYAEGRRMWINLKAYDINGNLLKEYGAYDPATGVLTEDTTIFEIKQGLTPELASYLQLPSGPSFHFVLNNNIYKDNRIPPRGFTQAALNQFGLQPVGEPYGLGQYWYERSFNVPLGTVRIRATLYYQVASKEYIDFLGANGGFDGIKLVDLWNTLPSNPQVVRQAWFPNLFTFFPIMIH